MIMKTNYPILRQILFAAAPLVLLAGCSDKDDPAPIGVAGVEVSRPTLELSLDGTERLTAAVTPDNAADKTLTWSSSDEAVATVSSEGVITAVRAGHTTITAAAGGKTGTCTVTVNPDIYTAGRGNGVVASIVPCVVKNNRFLYNLYDEGQGGQVNSIFVWNGDVYSLGDRERETVVWKNDTELYTLTTPENWFVEGYQIAVLNGDVYASGYAYDGNRYMPVMWKNGTVQFLPSEAKYGFAYSIAVSGRDVYVAGRNDDTPRVWKNGEVLYDLPYDLYRAEAASLCVSDGDVYVGGFSVGEKLDSGSSPTVWKNGELLYLLSDYSLDSRVISIATWKGDVYALGTLNDGNSKRNVLWKNDQLLYDPFVCEYGISVWNGDVYSCYLESDRRTVAHKNGQAICVCDQKVAGIFAIYVYTGPER